MSKVKINSNLFIGSAEWWRLQHQFDDWGFKRHIQANTKTYGIVKDIYFPELGDIPTSEALYVAKINACNDKVSLKPGVIIDKNAEFVVNSTEQNIDVPATGDWYWVKVKHFLSTEELGTVSVDTFGNVTGVGTEFTQILRGQPNFPSKIRFFNSLLGNADDYEVVSVIDDFNMVIQGDFTNETGLTFGVVGTFTPGYPVPVADELIFQYDSIEVTLVAETALNTPPAILEDYEFLLARVMNNGVTITLEDKRTNWWRTWGEWWVDFLDRQFNNPLIGIEGLQYTHLNSTRENNIGLCAWGFRFASYTINTGLKKMSILIGNGGTYKDTSFFNSSDFNDWRVYAKNGTWRTIIDSQKSGSQIVLTLDVLDPDDYGAADELFIAPPFEMIEIRARRDASIIDTNDQDQDTDVLEPFPWPNLERRWEFPINTQLAKLFLPAQDDCYKYNLTYRYRTFEGYTDWQTFPDDPIGYYDEKSYDNYGNLKLPIDRTQKPYVGHAEFGFIEVCEAPDSFQNFQTNVDTGDLFGVNTTELENATPVVELWVGTSKQYQHYKGGLTLTADMFIHLNKTKQNGDPLREGNFFLLQLEQWVNLDTFRLRIVEDYVNPTSFTALANLSMNDLMYARNNTSDDAAQSYRRGLFIRCTFNELGNWIVTFDSETCPKGVIRMVGPGAISGAFDGSGVGIKQGFWGWQLMNGNNGTVNMQDRFVMGTTAQGLVGATGGSNSVTLGSGNLPEHAHTFSGTTSSHSHCHKLYYRDTGTKVSEPNGDPNFARGDRHFSNNCNTDTVTHSHTFSGTTDPSGGTGSPTPVDTRPQFMTVLYMKKVV